MYYKLRKLKDTAHAAVEQVAEMDRLYQLQKENGCLTMDPEEMYDTCVAMVQSLGAQVAALTADQISIEGDERVAVVARAQDDHQTDTVQVDPDALVLEIDHGEAYWVQAWVYTSMTDY